MPKRRSPESTVVKFFYESPLDVAESILTIVKDVVAGRRPPAAKKRGKRQPKATADSSSEQTKPPTNAAGGEGLLL